MGALQHLRKVAGAALLLVLCSIDRRHLQDYLVYHLPCAFEGLELQLLAMLHILDYTQFVTPT